MRTRRTFLAIVLASVCILGCAAPNAREVGPAERVSVDRVLREIEAAVVAQKLDAVLAYYDSNAGGLVARIDATVRGLLGMDGAQLEFRVRSLAWSGDDLEAVALRIARYREYGRDQVQSSWETIRFTPTQTGWRIAGEIERDFARCLDTQLSLELAPESGRMHGVSTLRVEITAAGEDSLLIHLNRGLDVRSIRDARNEVVAFERVADTIWLRQAEPLRVGETREFTFDFEGSLFNETSEQGFSQVGVSAAGSFASGGTGWYPSLAGMGSKSTGRITYRLPAGTTVASSGRLVDTHVDGSTVEQSFDVARPLDFAFAAARYFHREQEFDGINLGVYLLTGGDDKAELYLKECAQVLRFECGLLGAYPFDGCAVVEIPHELTGLLGGSSAQGLIFFPTGVLPDDSFPLMLVAHECGHGWWGNLIASADGPIVDEGLAQATGLLCLAEFRGEKAMRTCLRQGLPGYRQSARDYFMRFADIPGRDLPMGVVPIGAGPNAFVHDLADNKGELVFSMLRDEIGHEAFVAGLRASAMAFGDKSISLADLRAAWEHASGRNLEAFFRQWFFRGGAPEFQVESTTSADGSGFVTSGTITQRGTPYIVDAELGLAIDGKLRIEKLAITNSTTPFSVRSETRPDFVVFDPQYKLLRWTSEFRNTALLASASSARDEPKIEAAVKSLTDFTAGAPPDCLDAHYVLGLCYQRLGRFESAAECFGRVLDRQRVLDAYQSAVALSQLHLGQVLDLLGRRDAALDSYRRTLELPDEADSHAAARDGLGAPFRADANSARPDRAVLERLVGIYDGGSGLVLHVALKSDGSFAVTQEGQGESPLDWVDGLRFRVMAVDGVILRFTGDPSITGVDILAGAQVIHVPRSP